MTPTPPTFVTLSSLFILSSNSFFLLLLCLFPSFFLSLVFNTITFSVTDWVVIRKPTSPNHFSLLDHMPLVEACYCLRHYKLHIYPEHRCLRNLCSDVLFSRYGFQKQKQKESVAEKLRRWWGGWHVLSLFQDLSQINRYPATPTTTYAVSWKSLGVVLIAALQ